MTTRLAAVVVPGDGEPWEALGFTVSGGAMAFGNGAIRLDPAARSMLLEVDGLGDVHGALGPDLDIDGVAVRSGRTVPAVEHANGCYELDHVVIMTPSIASTSAAIERVLGLPQRRVRETADVRQAFHRFPDRGCIVELVERPDATAASLWGLVVTTTDLARLAVDAGDLVGAPKQAVQPGRSIASARRSAGVGCALAFMSPG